MLLLDGRGVERRLCATPVAQGGINQVAQFKIGVTHDAQFVHVNLGQDTAYFAVPPDEAITIACELLEHAGSRRVTIEFSDGRPPLVCTHGKDEGSHIE